MRCDHCGSRAPDLEPYGGALLCPECLDMDAQAWGELDEIMGWDE